MAEQIELEGTIQFINIGQEFVETDSGGKCASGNRDLQIIAWLNAPGAEAKINFRTGMCEKEIALISSMPDDGIDILIKLRRYL